MKEWSIGYCTSVQTVHSSYFSLGENDVYAFHYLRARLLALRRANLRRVCVLYTNNSIRNIAHWIFPASINIQRINIDYSKFSENPVAGFKKVHKNYVLLKWLVTQKVYFFVMQHVSSDPSISVNSGFNLLLAKCNIGRPPPTKKIDFRTECWHIQQDHKNLFYLQKIMFCLP